MKRFMVFALMMFFCICYGSRSVAQSEFGIPYEIGSPQLTTLYISLTGDDSHTGTSPQEALRTIDEAWTRIPIGTPLSGSGYHLLIMPGTYGYEEIPNYWESRYGTADFPIIIEAAEGPNTVFIPVLNMFDVRYLYLLNLNVGPSGDAIHCERCDHFLVRGTTVYGGDPEAYEAQETLKINQSQYVYLENNDISGAFDNAVDFVAVQYGHILNNRIHNATDWCMYLKGGSASFYIAGNELFDCGTGGFTAGQGTGFQFMVEPYVQYEAYDIQFVDNVIHDTEGAGVGVNGGYNILIAFNTMVNVGERSHVMEFVFGSRSCDGQPGDEGRERCNQFAANGGWGNNVIADGSNFVRIPNRNVYVYNNIIYNSAPYRSQWQHLMIAEALGDTTIQAGSSVPVPTLADDNLQIRGNIIWNGDESMPLGIEGLGACEASNPMCNEAQLRSENAINTIEPTLNEFHFSGDFPAVALPSFSWDDSVPPGLVNLTIPTGSSVGIR